MIRLYITPDEQQPYLLSFERSSLSVGRAEDSDVRLQAPGVSSRHFRLRRIGDDVVLEDLGSRNGTYVDNLRIVGSQVLSRASEIRIAGFRIRLVDGSAGAAAKPVEQRPIPVAAAAAVPAASRSIVIAPGAAVGKRVVVEASAPRGEPVVTSTEARP